VAHERGHAPAAAAAPEAPGAPFGHRAARPARSVSPARAALATALEEALNEALVEARRGEGEHRRGDDGYLDAPAPKSRKQRGLACCAVVPRA
jgi:hypothetical protein